MTVMVVKVEVVHKTCEEIGVHLPRAVRKDRHDPEASMQTCLRCGEVFLVKMGVEYRKFGDRWVFWRGRRAVGFGDDDA